MLGANGEKLSKQNGAQALDLSEPMVALNQAAAHLGLPVSGEDVGQALTSWSGRGRSMQVLYVHKERACASHLVAMR
ncbi:glutamyl-Q tRNA(Asp) synthetase [Hydrogenophaga sp. T4]|nr:glutamyl-Q tRNA(Asp) synthetase [Hydrogenophaga sp. T4]